MRATIRAEVERIQPLDELERESQRDVLEWINSGAELCRLEKPATPPKHLISYFVVVDGDYLLLVDHINAELWLPTGGHVNPGEHPRDTALREAEEELSIKGEFLTEGPVFVTVTQTVGKTAGHTDVSLWYVLRGDRSAHLKFDQSEFREIKWFHKDDVPVQRSDKHMSRFLQKFFGASPAIGDLQTSERHCIRPASIDEADLLSALAIRSKAYWGYPDEFMEACRDELTVDPERMAADNFDCYVATDGRSLLGFYAIEKQPDDSFELEALFVEPEHIGKGVGHLLMQHAIRFAADRGASRLIIQGDPNAAEFYESHGAIQAGFRESESIPGRQLPLFEIRCREN